MGDDRVLVTHLAVFDADELGRIIHALRELRDAGDPDEVQVWMAAVSTDGESDAAVMIQRSDSQLVQDWLYPHGDVSLN